MNIEKLYNLEKIGIKLGLENTKKLSEYFGNPQNNYRTIHVAGTNGKGSTSSFIASILQEYGLKVGLYTSPHLIRFNERIKINGLEIYDEYIEDFLNNHYDYIYENKFTFFEATTLLAFKYFADEKVDIAVIETGLGGRLDSTNIINPMASVITNIDYDHQEFLGDTIEKIAFEKAGIVKKNVPVFCGNMYAEAFEVINDKAKELSAPVFKLTDYVQFFDDYFVYLNEKFEINDLPSYQIYNSALATLVINKLYNQISVEKIRKGISNIYKNTNFSGRFEFYHRVPDVIFDAAHNPNGVNAFIESFKRIIINYDKKYLIFGAMKDKDYKEMLNILHPFFDKIFFTDIQYDRSEKKENFLKYFGDDKYEVINNPEQKIKNFIEAKKNKDVLVFLGSIYILGNIKKSLLCI